MMRKEPGEVQVVSFKLDNEEYGIQINQVKEIINLSEITPLPDVNSTIEGVINLRGEIIPIINLKKRLGSINVGYSPEARIIVIEVDKQLLGLKVDEAVEVLHLDIKDIQNLPDSFLQLENQNLLAGIGKLDERLIVLLDLTRVLSNEDVQRIQKQTEEIHA
jgi:purine-binding chemotaxis protein CheW